MTTIDGFAQVENWERFNSSLLIEVTRPHGVFTCTGVAVNFNTLLTAAHCLDGVIKKVRVFTGKDYDPKAPSLAVKDFAIHPGYKPKESQYRHDLAKITLESKLPDAINIQQIFQGNIVLGKIYRFGFGARNKKNVRTVITPNFLRINSLDGVVELDDTFSQSGDSGGPVFVQNGSDIKLLAIHSTFSHGPLGRYSYNPLLNNYSSWIFQN